MFTKIKNGKRYCTNHCPIQLISWDYIKEILKESGFEETQKASPSEYIMKGCNGKIIVYVKFTEAFESNLIFLNDSDVSDQLKQDWTENKTFHKNGNEILDRIRALWDKL